MQKKSIIGDTVSFKCHSIETSVKWYFNTLFGEGIPLTNNSTLILNNIQVKDGGYYYCYGLKWFSVKKAHHFIAQAELKVYGINWNIFLKSVLF